VLSLSSALPAETGFARGTQIGKYIVVDRLGAGASGVVVSAFDPDLNRKIAIKVMRGRVTDEARVRLVREAQALAQLDHPNVITVHEVGTFDDEMFIAMEFAEQGTLRRWLAAKPRTWREILDRYIEAGRGLAAAHAAKLVHRDFKPDNVLVTASERVKVSDFGLVSVATERATIEAGHLAPTTPLDVSLTETGTLLGTPCYMAPEQHLLGRVDARADQFAFCVALHEALYGVRPFEGSDYYSLFTSVSEGKIVPTPRSPVPARIVKAIHRGLARDPEARWPTMDALLGELQRDRRPARWIAAAGIAAAAATTIAASTLGSASPEPGPCAAAPRRLAGVWDLGIQQKIRAAFAASGAPTHAEDWRSAETIVSAYADTWVAAERDNCAATLIVGTQTEHAFEVREACLDHRLSQLAGLSALWQDTRDPNVVRSASKAAIGLDEIAICHDAAGLADWLPPPADEASKQKIADVRRRITDGRGLMLADRFDKARAILAPLIDEAKRIGYQPVVAEAMMMNAKLAWLTDEKDVDTLAFDTAIAAQGTRHYEIAIRAWTLLIEIQSYRSHADAAKRWLRIAESLAEPLGDDPLRRANLTWSEARVDQEAGNLEAARDKLEHALAGHDEAIARGRGDVLRARHDRASLLGDLGNVLFLLGRSAEAEAALRRSVSEFDAFYGGRNMPATIALNTLAGVSYTSGRYDEARQILERVLDTATLYVQEPNENLAAYHTNLGEMLRSLGRYDEALQHLHHALDMRRKLFGDDAPELLTTYTYLADVLESMDRAAEARVAARHAVAIAEHAHGASSVKVAAPLLSLGMIEHDLGSDDEAIATYQRSLHIYESTIPSPHDIATIHNLIGVSLRAQRKYREALVEHRDALSRYERLVPQPQDDIRNALENIARTQLALGAPADAIPIAERELAILDADAAGMGASKHNAALHANARFRLAQALWDSERDRPRAVREAAAALATCATKQCDHDAIASWLAHHR